MPPNPRTRQACDRCHGQKLRCPKQAGSAICARCSKAGVPCAYSPAGPPPPPPLPAQSSGADPPLSQTPVLDWDAFSLDQLLNAPTVGLFEKGSPFQSLPATPVDPRAHCFDGLSTMMSKLNRAFDGLAPMTKLHVSASTFEEFCRQISSSHCLKESLELMLSQSQELVDLYPDAIRLAVEQQTDHNCTLPDCIHAFDAFDFGENPFEAAAPKIDYTLLNQLVSCHYRLHDITDLVLSHAQVCFRFSAAKSLQAGDRHQFDIPELRIGSFTASSRSSPSIIAAILVDLQSSLGSCIPKIQSAIDQDSSRESKVLSLQCDMLRERSDAIIERLKKLRDAVTKAGLLV